MKQEEKERLFEAIENNELDTKNPDEHFKMKREDKEKILEALEDKDEEEVKEKESREDRLKRLIPIKKMLIGYDITFAEVDTYHQFLYATSWALTLKGANKKREKIAKKNIYKEYDAYLNNLGI